MSVLFHYLFGRPCQDGHVFTWYSNTAMIPQEEIPEGTKCACGAITYKKENNTNE